MASRRLRIALSYLSILVMFISSQPASAQFGLLARLAKFSSRFSRVTSTTPGTARMTNYLSKSGLYTVDDVALGLNYGSKYYSGVNKNYYKMFSELRPSLNTQSKVRLEELNKLWLHTDMPKFSATLNTGERISTFELRHINNALLKTLETDAVKLLDANGKQVIRNSKQWSVAKGGYSKTASKIHDVQMNLPLTEMKSNEKLIDALNKLVPKTNYRYDAATRKLSFDYYIHENKFTAVLDISKVKKSTVIIPDLVIF